MTYIGRNKNIRLEAYRFHILNELLARLQMYDDTTRDKVTKIINELEFCYFSGIALIKHAGKLIDGTEVNIHELKLYQRGDSQIALREQSEFSRESSIDEYQRLNKIVLGRVSKAAITHIESEGLRFEK